MKHGLQIVLVLPICRYDPVPPLVCPNLSGRHQSLGSVMRFSNK
jgi:hypothetical protein